MAIDTAAKRRSAASAGWPFTPPGVTPDAAKPAAWRQQAGWGYSGVAAGEAATPLPVIIRIPISSSRAVRLAVSSSNDATIPISL